MSKGSNMTYKFLDWFKNTFTYESKDKIVTIRDYDYRDCFRPEIDDEYLEFLKIYGSTVEFFDKEKLRKEGKI